jgi:DNA repair protein RecO (recombination protein O)
MKALAPLSLTDIVAERKNKGNFDYLKEINSVTSPNLGNFDIVKSSITLFLNEVLHKLLVNSIGDPILFEFLFSSLLRFFTQDCSPDFHLRFLTALMRHLGFLPEDDFSSTHMIFNIEKSCFDINARGDKQQQELGYYFHCLLGQDLFPLQQHDIVPYAWRNPVLELILNYYSFHIANLSQLKSPEIIKMILHS